MTTTESSTEINTGERANLLQALAQRRYFLRYTVRELTDEQAALHPTASQLCLGGVIQHVSDTERQWVDFILDGPASSPASDDAEAMRAWLNRFQMAPGVTLETILAEYAEVAERTDQVIRDLPDLDITHPLPEAPWYEPGESWSARQVVLHIISETAQHSGHADILRESIDGAKSMG